MPVSKRRSRALSTIFMNVVEYLADPRRATAQAERAGRVVVKDERGTIRLVISSNRATELLLDQS
jgi:hypothetical protein